MTVFSLSQVSTAVGPANMMQDPLLYRDLGQKCHQIPPLILLQRPRKFVGHCLSNLASDYRQATSGRRSFSAAGTGNENSILPQLPTMSNIQMLTLCSSLFLFLFEYIIISLQHPFWSSFSPLFIRPAFPVDLKPENLTCGNNRALFLTFQPLSLISYILNFSLRGVAACDTDSTRQSALHSMLSRCATSSKITTSTAPAASQTPIFFAHPWMEAKMAAVRRDLMTGS